MNSLTTKKYWNESWKKIKLPARFFFDNYSHMIITEYIDRFFINEYKTFLEIGGCPGRWAELFSKKYGLICDNIDNDEENNAITKENYDILKIQGEIFCEDISLADYEARRRYDVVLSDGLLEHFSNPAMVFDNHEKHLNEGGLLIIAVPNIKKSLFYHFLSKHNKENYAGFRHVDKIELYDHAKKSNLDILYCDYLGVFNIGLVNFKNKGYIKNKIITLIYLASSFLLKKANIKKETKIFSPYIYLFARKKSFTDNKEYNNDQNLWTFHQIDNVQNLILGHFRQEIIFKIISKVIKKGKILEIGFGDGYLLKKLSKYYDCYGADISEENVIKMKKNIPQVTFKTIGIDGKLPYRDECFDMFVASEVFEHMDFDELQICVSEIKRILKPDGCAIITVPAEENLKINECFCPNCGEIFHKWGHKQSWNREKIIKVFSSFEYIKIKNIFVSSPNLNFFGKISLLVKKILFKIANLYIEDSNFFIIIKNKK